MDEREDEIDTEFEHHLASSAEDLVRQGMDPAHARTEAEHRFGSRRKHHQRCLAQQRETTMRKAMTITAVLALLAASALAIDGWRRAFRSEAQLHAMRAEYEHLVAASASTPRRVIAAPRATTDPGTPGRLDDSSVTPAPSADDASLAMAAHSDDSKPRLAKIMGAVARGGLYATADGETLRELIARAGGALVTEGRIQIEDDDAPRTGAVTTIDLRALMCCEIDDVILGPRVRIYIDNGVGRGVIYVDGKIARPGVYQLPDQGRLTAARLIAAAGGAAGEDPIQVRVIRKEAIDSVDRSREFLLSRRDSESFTLLPDDHVIVATRTAAESK